MLFYHMRSFRRRTLLGNPKRKSDFVGEPERMSAIKKWRNSQNSERRFRMAVFRRRLGQQGRLI